MLTVKSITLLGVAAAAVLQAAAAAKCGDQTCRKDAPCCVKGFCNSNAMYCMPLNCEPGNSLTADSCWETAHCVKDNVDFGRAGAFAQVADYGGDPRKAAFVSQFEPSHAKISNGELELELVKQSDGKGFGATVSNTRAIQYGTVTTVMRSGCVSGGVVSSFIIRNDALGDEIDFEFVGADTGSVETNFYWHDELDYTKMVKSPPLADTTRNYHTYQIQWTPDAITWSVNGNSFRTVKRSDTWDAQANVFKYPDSEAYISYSIWDGGSGAQGTSEWAGGAIDWARGPFIAGVKSIDIDCFYKGNDTTYTPPGGNDSDDDSDDEDSSSAKSSSDDKDDKDDSEDSEDSDDSEDSEDSEDSDASSEDRSSDEDDEDHSSSSSDDDDDVATSVDEATDASDDTGAAAALAASLGPAVAAAIALVAF
ncbi:putative glycosidase CRH2 [Coemansia sp. RSA 552]|nr:putative glycosidase CRH2 [Coemansia sp. RSA 552]